MSDTKYGVYYNSPISKSPESFMPAVGTSGSPSYCWALLRAHLGFKKGDITNKELQERGYRVGVVPVPAAPQQRPGSTESTEGQERPGRTHYVDRIANLDGALAALTPYPMPKAGPDWPFWIGLVAVIAIGAAVGWLVN